MEKSNPLPKTEGCWAKGKEPEVLKGCRAERSPRSVPREKREPQAGPAFRLSHSASIRTKASGEGVLLPEPTTRKADTGEAPEGLPGSKSVARVEGLARNRGGPEAPCRTNYESQAGGEAQREGAQPGDRESDRPIVSGRKAQAPKPEKEPTC